MKLKLITIFLTLLICFGLAGQKNNAYAECGSYFAQASPDNCVNAENNHAIHPFAVCTQNSNICCNNQTQCDQAFPGNPPNPPPAKPDEVSTADCGVWNSQDPTLGRVCLELGTTKRISEAVSCTKVTACCKSASLCPHYYKCGNDPSTGKPTGQCVRDDANGTFTEKDQVACNSQCAVETPPAASATEPTCDTSSGKGINSAIGCIPINSAADFVGFFLRWGVGIGGGIAFLLILYAGFVIMTSSGVPERLKSGQELLTSAITGLILLIFSIFILRLIGVDILKIPGFGV